MRDPRDSSKLLQKQNKKGSPRFFKLLHKPHTRGVQDSFKLLQKQNKETRLIDRQFSIGIILYLDKYRPSYKGGVPV